MIYRIEKFPTSAQSAHNLQKFDENPDILMAVDPKTRPSSMCQEKKIIGHLCQKKRCRYKNILQSMLLKDTPRTEPVRSREDNLQKKNYLL